MAWMIVRIEPRENDTLPERDCLPAVIQLTKGNVRAFPPKESAYRALMEKNGFTSPNGQPGRLCPFEEWPFIAYCYLSPNREGKGRIASQLRRVPAKRLTTSAGGSENASGAPDRAGQ
jgi:hypothetical protein